MWTLKVFFDIVPITVYGFPIDTVSETSIGFLVNKQMEETEDTILFHFHCKFDVSLDAVQVLEKGIQWLLQLLPDYSTCPSWLSYLLRSMYYLG